MTNPPKETADAVEETNLFDGDGPRGDDRPAPHDSCANQGLQISTEALSTLGPLIASIMADEPPPPLPAPTRNLP